MTATVIESEPKLGDVTPDPGNCYPKGHVEFDVAYKQLGIEEGTIEYAKAKAIYIELCSLYDERNPARVITTEDIKAMLDGGFVIVGLDSVTANGSPSNVLPKRFEVFGRPVEDQREVTLEQLERVVESYQKRGLTVHHRTVSDVSNTNRAEILVNVISRGQ